MYFVYILYSKSIKRYYVGSTNNIDDRLIRHNRGQGKYTKKGIPWILLKVFEMPTRPESVRLEMRIKKRGAKRYIADLENKHRGMSQSG